VGKGLESVIGNMTGGACLCLICKVASLETSVDLEENVVFATCLLLARLLLALMALGYND
jgi:hypothetical protein